ncbi:uncharacterized protein LOC119170833 isoform X1 [Rhipicephalus microplus]|uniref:uncharacterized protein LOC119170833 isoform X1 n=1 Tax=Rhipicephalus microplus TaxID=6941 RepID=UPI003F6D4BDC
MTTTWEKETVDTSVGIIRMPTLRGSAGMLVIAVTVETLRSLMWRSLTLQFRGKHCHMLGGASIEPVTLGLVKPCLSCKVNCRVDGCTGLLKVQTDHGCIVTSRPQRGVVRSGLEQQPIAINWASKQHAPNVKGSTSASDTWPDDLRQVKSTPVLSVLIGCQSRASNTSECIGRDARGDEDTVSNFRGRLQT